MQDFEEGVESIPVDANASAVITIHSNEQIIEAGATCDVVGDLMEDITFNFDEFIEIDSNSESE